MNTGQSDNGFTLVELMTVVLLLGILIALAVPIFASVRSTAEQRTCFANQRTIEGAAQMYRAATGGYPPAAAIDVTHALITGRYIQNPPVCPKVGTGAYYTIDSSGTVGTPAGCPHGHF